MTVTDILAERAFNRLRDIELAKGDFEYYSKKSHLLDIYKLLQSEQYYSEGVKKLCYVCDSVIDDELEVSLVKQCIQSSRLFLYQDMLVSKGLEFKEESIFENSQKAFYSLESEIVLTKEQKHLFDLFSKKKKLVVSAPTSFGKSRIIREIVKTSSYKNIIVIVPTNALLSETYFSFRMDENLAGYNLVFSTHIEPVEKDSIYIFTPEKFDVYTDEYDIDYDFFVFDEVYKIDSNDKRSSVFSSCLYKAYKSKCDYYLIGPYFNKFSPEFIRKTDGFFQKYSTDIVQKKVANYFENMEAIIEGKTLRKLKSKDARLRNVINTIEGQNIVYVGRKDVAETRARMLSNKGKRLVESEKLDELISYIEVNISSSWRLISCLRKGVAFHHAGIPKYIQTEIVDLFNEGVIDTIVCTPTLTEGVNTSAKNVIFYDTTKAGQDLTGFEVKNIVGRSGRFGQHFVGRAIFLEQHVSQDNIDEISYPIFDYDRIPDEDYIQIDTSDLKEEGRERKDYILKIAEQNGIPLSLLKNNKYVPFENQLELIVFLRKNPEYRKILRIKSGLPDKLQVDRLVELIHDILFSKYDRKDSWSTGNLSRLVKYQIYFNPTIKMLVAQHSAKNEDTRIRNILELVYRYFEYSFPKYISVFENIFNFVYSDNLSLSLLSAHLQYGNDKKYNILLTDAGVPRSLVNKLAQQLEGLESIDQIRQKIESQPRILRDLSKIEMRMLSKRI